MTPLAPRRHHVLALGFVGNDADRIGARGGAELDAEHAEAAGGAPDEHVVARAQAVRLVAEQHAVGGGQRQGVGCGLLPGQVLGPVHQLPVLHPAELGERAVGRLVAPDALRRREHRVAAVAFLVVAVVLIAVDDDLVADLPALDLGADRPDDARGVGAGDVIGLLVHVERRDRLAERRPDAVVVDARRHHQNEHVVAVERPGRHDLDLHRALPAARAAPCGSPRRTSTSARGRAAGSRRFHTDP